MGAPHCMNQFALYNIPVVLFSCQIKRETRQKIFPMKSDNSTFKQGKKQYIYIYCNTLLYILLLFIIYIIIYIYICIYICINIYTVYIYICNSLCIFFKLCVNFRFRNIPNQTRSPAYKILHLVSIWFVYALDPIHWSSNSSNIPLVASGNLTVCYWKWPYPLVNIQKTI